MWSDAETEIDYLNFTETAEITVDLIRDPRMLPISIGLFGGWGAGKSSLLKLVEAKLVEDGAPTNHLIVKFDAWLYQSYDDARAALMQVIAAALVDEAKDNEGLLKKVKRFSKRINYLRLAGLVGDLGLAAATGGAGMGMVSGAAAIATRLFEGAGTEDDAGTVKDDADQAKEAGEGLLREGEGTSPEMEIAAFRREYGEILTALGRSVVVMIDNLDRCLPRNAIQTLEAIRLFLFLPNTAFVIAADEEMIRHAVKRHYHDPDDRHVADYLDKLIQIPIRVPRLGVQEITAYLFLLFASIAEVDAAGLEVLRLGLQKSMRESWKQEPITADVAFSLVPAASAALRNQFAIAERLAPILANAPGVMGNPRIVKRLLNTIRLRTKLAAKHGMPLDEAVIAKLAVFERCTSEAAYGHLCRLINEANKGQVDLLEKMESDVGDPVKLEPLLPEPWKNFRDFVVEWLDLKPSLGHEDLRSAVYLSREVIPLRVAKNGLSVQAIACLNGLMRVTTTASPSARKLAEDLALADQSAVMEAIIGELRRISDWSARPNGVVGAQILVAAAPSTAVAFIAFLSSLELSPKPLWLQALLKPKT